MVIMNMQSVIYHHAYNVFRDKSLPPNMVDQRAMRDAQMVVIEYTRAGILTDFFTRLNGGRV